MLPKTGPQIDDSNSPFLLVSQLTLQVLTIGSSAYACCPVSSCQQLNGQTTENQRLELEAVAGRNGWAVVEIYEDAGISGAKGREKRPAFDRMLRAAVRREFDVIMAWSVDRLGPSLQDLVAFLSDIHAKGVELYLHQQGIDTTTPSGKAMFQMMGVFAEFERAVIRQRVLAGLRRARAKGTMLGRPTISPLKEHAIRADLAAGLGFRKIMARHRVGTSVIQRIKAAVAAEKAAER